MKKLSFGTGGIQRVTDEDRAKNPSEVWNACTFWLSANMALATLNTGMVGGEMGLAFWDSFAIIMVVNVLACLLPAWTAKFGLTGLRMTTSSRYSFGYWDNMFVVVFSMISTTGWNAISSISGASCLSALSNGACPQWDGVIIICALGITWIHRLDFVLWIAPFIVWCMAAGTRAKHFGGHATKSPTGANGAASALSLITVIFSFAVSWINCAADCNVKMPVSAPRYKIFVTSYIGILVPTTLVQTLGAALYSAAEVNPSWKSAYLAYGVGGPLRMALGLAGGFGKFLLVLAGLSSNPNNVPNNYSFATHAQNFSPWALCVPRIAFVTFGFIAAITVGCCGTAFFSDTLQTFLSMIGY
ncbi:hypothetical protein P154DRAFT_607432 [Amniculicola lignicola CBS 123094]|uniref:Uncharacterized protein n=1 Tax=Amniculicola lignicola CBS 123094 TaxID=1392246 RepID=A0A6A5W6U1_9PLEO|nr:hypothetical protein P154DRAFT_607432 [Amniculicola lignicola CBS 123094]